MTKANLIELEKLNLEIFHTKYVKRENGCWEWVGSKNINGYGLFSSRPKIQSHRISFLINNPDFDQELLVCHKCDNPPCVNPDHLFSGTVKDNTQDMIRKGRNKKWEPFENCYSITKEMFLDLKKQYESKNVSLRAIARENKVDFGTLFHCFKRNGVSSKRFGKKLSFKDVTEIRKLRSLGWTHPKIAKKFNLNPGAVCAICLGIRWGDFKTPYDTFRK